MKRSTGRHRAGYRAASEGEKGTVVALSRAPGWLGTGLLLSLQLLSYCDLQGRDVHVFGTGESVQAVTQVLPLQETEQGKEIPVGYRWDGENEHHEFLGPRNCPSGLRCCK